MNLVVTCRFAGLLQLIAADDRSRSTNRGEIPHHLFGQIECPKQTHQSNIVLLGHLRVPVLQAAIPNRSCSTLMLTMCISNWSFAVRAPTSISGRRSSKSITLF